MNLLRNQWAWLALTLFGFLLVSVTTRPTLPEANAQLVNVDVDGVRRVIGDEPRALGGGEYRVRQKWFPRSLAVYLNGKRCQRGVDYVVVHRERTITFQVDTDDDSVVIIDYEPR